jgi:glycosyltransferase involved in cell wall biosynthesis
LKISIITACFNSSATIRDTIESVLAQSHEDIEYIIIDGGSKDSTQSIVAEYGDKISKFISEKDNGIYDAMNKGVSIATGDIVGIINSDDFYFDLDVLSEVAASFDKDGMIDAAYGDLLYVDANNPNKIVRTWKSCEYAQGLFESGWHPPHPSFFVRKNIYERHGTFNTDFKIAADYELMLRLMRKHSIKTVYIPKVFVKMRTGGTSNRSLSNIIKANIECLSAWKVNELPSNLLIFFKKPISKIKQFIKGKI